MRIECPSCGAEYDVPAARVGSRRLVRCSRCSVEWTAEPEVAAEPEPAGDPAEEAFAPAPVIDTADRPAPPLRPPPRRGLVAAWVASFLVLAGAAAAAAVWRTDVVAFWPPSSRLLGPGAVHTQPMTENMQPPAAENMKPPAADRVQPPGQAAGSSR